MICLGLKTRLGKKKNKLIRLKGQVLRKTNFKIISMSLKRRKLNTQSARQRLKKSSGRVAIYRDLINCSSSKKIDMRNNSA